MAKILNKWAMFVEKISTPAIGDKTMTKKMMQILLFYVLSFLLAYLADKIYKELGLIIFLSTLMLTALILVTLLVIMTKEMIVDIKTAIRSPKSR